MPRWAAQGIIYLLDLLAIFAVGYCVLDYRRVETAVAYLEPAVVLDSGTYYLPVLSVLWVLTLVQWVGLSGRIQFAKRWGGLLAVLWLVACLVLANVIPGFLQKQLDRAGYQRCQSVDSPSRVARGAGFVYRRGPCDPALPSY